jgi:hypothetical protein
MKPIFTYNHHSYFTHYQPTILYELNQMLYWATEEGLSLIQVKKLYYTNLGDPFREFARLAFTLSPSGRLEEIDIAMEDAVQLVQYCQEKGWYYFKVDQELASNKEFLNLYRKVLQLKL